MTYNDFIYKWNGRFVDLFTRTQSGKMNMTMLGAVSQIKVFQSVVAVIAVNVVNYIFRSKFSTQMIFKDKSIVFSLPSWMQKPLHFFELAFGRTKNKFSSFMTFVISEANSAVVAVKPTFSGFVITNSAAKSRFLTGWSFEIIFANFANINHYL